MGKIIFDNKWGGEPISNFERSVKEIAALQYFQRKYRMDIIEIVELEDDCTITIDIRDLNTTIDYRQKYDSLRLILPNEERMKLLREFEDFEETIYNPLLPFLSGLFCKNKDTDLLDKYLKIMIINQTSANESPA